MIVRVLVGCSLWLTTPAYAQLDPILFLQRARPTVILAVDTADRMAFGADGTYYDPFTYQVTGAEWEATLGVSPSNSSARYRRKYEMLDFLPIGNLDRFSANRVSIVGDRDLAFAQFWSRSRLGVARAALASAVSRNQAVARFGLVRLRQANPRVGAERAGGPVFVTDPTQQSPTEGAPGRWKVTETQVDTANGNLEAAALPLVRADAPSANTEVLTILGRTPEQSFALLPAGEDSRDAVDAPVTHLLEDARAEALRMMSADTACRNTVVVLIVGGGEGTTATGDHDPAAVASTFLNVAGHRVPIHVMAIAPPAGSVAQLQAIARNSGGAYTEITRAMIEAAAPESLVPEASRGINFAVQHAFAQRADVDTPPTAALPTGPASEHQTVSPIVGTVNLEGALSASGQPLVNTRVLSPGGSVVPQRSNVLFTAGLAVPGLEGRLRAFRLYTPVADSAQASGYTFKQAATPLWTATVPGPASRNIYTALPDGTFIAFKTANAGQLSAHLRTTDAEGLIDFVRSQPIGAIIDSTPAVLDAPSLDPPPDAAYAAFAAQLADRRTLLFVGANDGMLHAIDARTGVEVWAFIPFNLLPKLRALPYGQAVGSFNYFVDSSAKVADVRLGGQWRTMLVIGEGPGGTFYQALDVTLAGLPGAVPSGQDGADSLLAYFANAERIQLFWSFPSYASFDAALGMFGDVRHDASNVEKTVGETWSDPAVGQVESDEGTFAVIVGSGFLPYSRQQASNRGGVVAGTTLYLLDAATGAVLDARSVGSDGVAETLDNCAIAGDCRRMKNALQADPVATGPPDTRYITRAYIGDLDGRVWSFTIGSSDGSTARFQSGPSLLFDGTAYHPIFASLATVNVGGSQDYIFFGSGSDSLPSTGVSQSYKLFGVLDQGGSGSKRFEIALEATDNAAGDEKVSGSPAVAGDIVFFTTTTYRPSSPCTAMSANLYAVTFVGGTAYDTSGDGRITKADSTRIRTVSGGRATAPYVVDQHLVFGAAETVQILGDPNDFNNSVGQVGVRILSWRGRR